MPLYLCDIVGTGADGDPFRPALDAYGVQWSCVEDQRSDASAPGGKMLVSCAADPSMFAADPRIAVEG